MSLNAAALKLMADKGLLITDVVEIAEAMESRTKSADRQQRYRDRKRNERDVTRNVTPPPYEDTSTPRPPSETKGVSSGGKRKRATQIPSDFAPVMSGKSASVVAGWPPGRLDDELANFRDHHTAKGTKSYDWQASWRTWVTNSKRWEPRNGRQQQPNTIRGTRPSPALDMWREANAELEAERGNSPPDLGTRLALPSFRPS